MASQWGHPSPAKSVSRRRVSPLCERGFTLAEVAVTIMILAILAVTFTPKITDALARIRVNAAAQKLVADIRFTRDLSLSKHATYGLEFNTGGNFYQLFSVSGGTKTVIMNPHKGVAMTVDYDDLPEFGGTTMGSMGNICTDTNQCDTKELRVDAFGTPRDRLNAAFTETVTIVLQNGSFSRTVRVTPETGFTCLSGETNC